MNSESEFGPGRSVVVEPPTTLLEHFEPKEYPGTVDLWRLVVQIPMPPAESAGGIALPEDYLEDMEYAAYVGQVRAMGPLCVTAITRSKIDLNGAHKCKVGDWVQFGKHQGDRIRTMDGTLWVILSDTQIIGVTETPEAFDCISL